MEEIAKRTQLRRRTSKGKKDFTKVKFIVFACLAGALLFIATFASFLTPYDPYLQDMRIANQAPSAAHWLGTDQFGRDMLSRVISGSTMTIFSSLLLVVIIAVFGTIIGILCGYVGGKTDSIIMRVSDVFLAFPGMVFAIAVAGVLGGGISNAVISLALISWPKFARIARGQVLTIKNSPYMWAARLGGCRWPKMVFKHIMPNIVGPIIVTAALDVGVMIMELAGLSFLGLGAQPPVAEWGSMMSKGRSMLQSTPWMILAPGAAVLISVMIFNLLGDTVRDMLDPTQQRSTLKTGFHKVTKFIKKEQTEEMTS